MTENESANEQRETVPDTVRAKLDLSRYRTGGLVENLIELISVPHALRRVIVTAFILTIVVLLTSGLIFYEATMSGFGWLLLCAYLLIAGFVLGVLLGLLRVLSRAFVNIEELLEITLKITENAGEDYGNLQSGVTRMPSAGELVEQVYEDVLLPTMEEAASEAFGVIGRPILWLYRRSIGAAVRYVIKKMARFAGSDEQAKATVETAENQIGTFAKYAAYIQSYTTQATDFVHRVSRSMRFYATLPLYIAFCVCLFLASVPILILRFFATGEPPE